MRAVGIFRRYREEVDMGERMRVSYKCLDDDDKYFLIYTLLHNIESAYDSIYWAFYKRDYKEKQRPRGKPYWWQLPKGSVPAKATIEGWQEKLKAGSPPGWMLDHILKHQVLHRRIEEVVAEFRTRR